MLPRQSRILLRLTQTKRSHHRRNETAHSKESIMAEWVLIALIVLALTILVLNGLIFQHARRPKCGRLPLDEHYC
jgi:hypothetical protein